MDNTSIKKRLAGLAMIAVVLVAAMLWQVWGNLADPVWAANFCDQYGERLPRFCQRHQPQVQVPTVEVIAVRLRELLGPRLQVAEVEVTVEVSNTTALPVTEFDENPLGWVGAQVHNFFAAEDLVMTDTFRAPLYLEVIQIAVADQGGFYALALPELTAGPPAPVGPRTTSYQGRIIAERDVDKTELIDTVLDRLVEEAAAEVARYLADHAGDLACLSEQVLAQMLDQLDFVVYGFQPSRCGAR